MRSRTRPLKTSAPPPGSEPRPACLSSASTSSTLLPLILGEVGDLAGRERLDVHVGRQLLERAHHLEVVLERQVGVLAADDVDLGDAADGQGLASLVHDLVDREGVGVGVALVVAEGAEQAAVAAHVGVVDVAVADEEDLVADGAGAGEVGHGAQGEDVVALEQRGGLRGRRGGRRPRRSARCPRGRRARRGPRCHWGSRDRLQTCQL